jgi:hypothetical protein
MVFAGVYYTTLCDFRLKALNYISPVRECVDNHDMSAHIEALRIIRTRVVRSPPVWQPPYNNSTKQWAMCSVCNSDPTWPYITKVILVHSVI